MGASAFSAIKTRPECSREASKGKDVVFEYTMTVNADALTDGDRINTFKLNYGDNYTASS